MKKSPLQIAVFIVVELMSCRTAMTEDLDSQLRRFRTLSLSLTQADERRTATGDLFSTLNEHQIDDLIEHDDSTIAIRAAWQELAAKLAYPETILDYREERRVQIARFVGRVEGRLKTSLPQVWIDGLNQFDFNQRLNSADLTDERPPEIVWGMNKVGVLNQKDKAVYDGADVVHDGVISGKCTLERNKGGSAVLTTSDGIELVFDCHKLNGLSVARHKNKFVVFECHGHIGDAYVLHVFAMDDGHSWKEVHTVRRILLGSGAASPKGHVASILFRNDKLLVWGLSNEGCYCDSYDPETLEIMMAFTTAH